MSRADYAHWNEDADYMWWHEEGKHHEVNEPDDWDADRDFGYADEVEHDTQDDCVKDGEFVQRSDTAPWCCDLCDREMPEGWTP